VHSPPCAMQASAYGLRGVDPLRRRGNSVIAPVGVMRPILLPSNSANQRLPSGPAVIPFSMLLADGTPNSVMTPPQRWPRDPL
jgi:hypothetical protein